MFAPQRVSIRPLPGLWLSSLLCVFAVLQSLPDAIDASASVQVAFRLVLIWTLFQFSVRTAVAGSIVSARSLISAYIIGCIVTATWAAMQASGISPLVGAGTRATGLSLHPNGLGGILAIGSTMAIQRVLLGRRPKSLHLASAAVLVTGVLLSGSVSAMLALVAGIIGALIVNHVSWRHWLTVCAMVLIFWLLIDSLPAIAPEITMPTSRIAEVQGLGAGPSTIDSRLETIAYAWTHIQENPLSGVGLDDASGATIDGTVLVHNWLVRAQYQGGLALLIAVSLAAATMLAKNRAMTAAGYSWRIDRGIESLAASVLAAIVFSMTGPILFERWFWLPMILTSAQSCLAGRAEDRRDIRR